MDRRTQRSLACGALAGAGLLAMGVIGTMSGIVSLYRRRSRRFLQGKVVLITGSSRGLGLALAEEFATGLKVILNARDENELKRAKATLLEKHSKPRTS